MKLQEVLEMLARFGVQEDEARQLLTQDDGWQILQTRVEHIWSALGGYIEYGVEYKYLVQQYEKIQRLKLKSVKKSPEQKQQEQRDLADKFKRNGKKPSHVEDLKEMANAWEGMGLGKLF